MCIARHKKAGVDSNSNKAKPASDSLSRRAPYPPYSAVTPHL